MFVCLLCYIVLYLMLFVCLLFAHVCFALLFCDLLLFVDSEACLGILMFASRFLPNQLGDHWGIPGMICCRTALRVNHLE